MKTEQLPMYALAVVVLIVGLAFAGVPIGTLLVVPLALACPVMMFFMMRGMDRDHAHRNRDDRTHHQP